MRVACEIQNLARRMQGRGSKEELRQQVTQVTLETHKLQDKAQDLKNVFEELESLHREAGGCCFPFKYIMLRDMVQDMDDLAGNLQHKWYGTTDRSTGTLNNKPARRGVVNRLVENCRAFNANRQALNQYEVIMEGLNGLKHKQLEQTLEERQTALTQQKRLFSQLQDLLSQLQELHKQSQDTWFLPRYFMLQRGVRSTLAAFEDVAHLAELSETSSSRTGHSHSQSDTSSTRNG